MKYTVFTHERHLTFENISLKSFFYEFLFFIFFKGVYLLIINLFLDEGRLSYS